VILAYGCWSVISVTPAESGTGTVRQEPPPGGKYRPWALARRRQGDAAALADPGDDQPVRVHQRVSARNLQHQERIGIDPAGVKVSRPAIPAVRNPAHESPCIGRDIVGGAPSPAMPALARVSMLKWAQPAWAQIVLKSAYPGRESSRDIQRPSAVDQSLRRVRVATRVPGSRRGLWLSYDTWSNLANLFDLKCTPGCRLLI